MPATRMIVRMAAAIAAFFFAAACDDDDKKTTTYEIDVYKTENVRLVIRPVPSKDSKKPRVTVAHHPDVEVETVETDPGKKEIVKYTSAFFLTFLVLLLHIRRQDRGCSGYTYLVDPSSSPTYQRG